MRFRTALAGVAAIAITLSCATCSSSSSGGPVASCPTTGVGTVGTGGYPASALPHGACSGASDCELLVAESCEPACAGYGAANVYRCTCASGAWSCKVTSQGDGTCACLLDAAAGDADRDAAAATDASGDGG
jgi:hypothetical protein